MDYRVRYEEDTMMPRGHDYVLVEEPGVTTVFFRRSMLRLNELEQARILEAAWGGYRHALAVAAHIPLQRQSQVA